MAAMSWLVMVAWMSAEFAMIFSFVWETACCGLDARRPPGAKETAVRSAEGPRRGALLHKRSAEASGFDGRRATGRTGSVRGQSGQRRNVIPGAIGRPHRTFPAIAKA